MTFEGDLETKSTLYVVAQEEIERIQVKAILKGPIFDPLLTFRSNPALSDQEILSRILFGKGISDITPIQATQLSQAILSLNSDNGEDLLERFQRNIGIDRIDLNANSEDKNEVSIRVGKYISRGVLISLHKSINSEHKHVAIEADIMSNFKVEAEVGSKSEGKMSLKWKKDY